MLSASFETVGFSVVLPVRNEQECLSEVLAELRQALDGDGIGGWEVIVVDDGSTDATPRIVRQFAEEDARFRFLLFDGHFGQTAALDAGLRAARGDILATMDGDGQNDPHDFSRLLEALESRKVDMMLGIRRKREDSIVRRISSRIANGVRNWATGETVTDVGCAIRVFRATCIRRLKLFEGMHRFFPTLVRMEGYSIDQIPVHHRPRRRGISKYGINNRLWCGLRDIFAVRWMKRRNLAYRIRERGGFEHPV